MMKKTIATPRPTTRSSVLLMTFLALVLLIPMVVSGCGAPGSTVAVQPATSSPSATGLAPDSVLAERYGVQVTLIGITAAGGVIDFRYRVVDPDKANQWLKDPKLMPDLVVEDSGAILTHPEDAMKETRDVKAGEVHYMLYPNNGNVVKPGAQVSVTIGDAHFGPYTAQQ
jgi:hypothetical protein